MKKLSNFFQILILLVFLSSYSQSSFEKEVIEPLTKDALYTEKVFLHINKRNYTSADAIWFKAYVVKNDNKPSKKTTRLRVELLDTEGEIILSKNIFIFNGAGKGQFELNSTLAPGKYFIRAYTNYMLNFQNDFVFTQEIQISGGKISSKKESNKYDVQIFPESGNLLENSRNIIAVKATLNGKGIDYVGEIVTSENQIVSTFKSEHIGLSKTSFNYEIGKTYKAKFKFQDTLITIQFPRALSKGVILEVDNSNSDSLIVEVKTNNLTLNDSLSRYRLLFHQRNNIIGFTEFSDFDKASKKLIFDKSTFFEGVNTATLFQNNIPIAERKFFVAKEENTTSATIEKVDIQSDSIQLKVGLQGNSKIKNGNLSISVLKIINKEFVVNQDIKIAFLLSPYVKGFIEKPSYYFNSKNTNRLEHLDLLLLTQGWSRYSLEEMINNLNPRATFNFEVGFELSGKINPRILFNELALISNKNIIIDKVFLNGKKDFQFKNLLIYKQDTLKISFLKPLNEIAKTEGFVINPLKKSAIPNFEKPENNFISEEEIVRNSEYNNWLEGTSTLLKEVSVSGKKKSEAFNRRRFLVEKYVNIVPEIGKYYELEKPENPKSWNDQLMSFLKFDQGVELKNYQGVENYLEVFGKYDALLFIDGVEMDSSYLPGIDLSLEDIEEIMVQPIRGSRIYQVFTTEKYKANKTDLFDYHIVLNGYDKSKKYYTPLYYFNNNDLDVIEVDWKPNILTNDEGEATFKLSKNALEDKLFFSIQGFTDNGLLISDLIVK